MKNYIWDRQKEETEKAYRAFCIYRDLPAESRNLDDASLKYGTTKGNLLIWSGKNRWVQRVTEYDAHRDKLRRDAEEKAEAEVWAKRRKEFVEKQFKTGVFLHGIGSQGAVSLSGKLDELSATDVTRLVECGAGQVAKAMGDPDTVLEGRGNLMSALSPDVANFLFQWMQKPGEGATDEEE